MPPKDTEKDPIEKKSYAKWLFVLGGLFFLVSNWAFYDEVISRRSWKGYQAAFNTLEKKRVEEEYQKAKAAIDAQDQQKDQTPETPGVEPDPSQISLRKIRLQMEQAEIRMESQEYQKAKNELHTRKIKFDDAKQNFGFTKADQDEVFYEWKHALEEGDGHQDEAEKYKKKYYDLETKLQQLKQKRQVAEDSVNEVQKILSGYEDELKKWKMAEKKILEPLVKIHKRLDAIADRSDDIQQVVINDLGKSGVIEWGTVDRCQSCHVAINRDGFENEKNPYKTHPFRAEIFGKHPVEQFGCTTCHGGQGRATQIKGKPLEEGDFAHGYVHHWPDSLMRGDTMQSSCTKCHLDQWRLDHAPVVSDGKKLFWDLGCTGCHAVRGFEDAPKVGPSLLKVGSKVSEEWILQWIKNPRDYLPHTRMPKPPLDIEDPGQSEKVASYILQASEAYTFPLGKFPGGNVEEGKKTFETVGCLGCHTMGDKGSGLAPALDNIAKKTTADWIYNWIQDPKSYNPTARMPNLRLTPQEAANVTAYLIQHGQPLPQDKELEARLHDSENSKKGFLLISQYGCYGCHNIKGFENASKLSVELTAFGRKDIHELDFGDAKIQRTWMDWTAGKLHDPRMYLTERTSSRMPNFGLTDAQIHTLAIFLKGLKKEDVPTRFLLSKINLHQKEIDDGRRLVERLNCKGCHMIEGGGRLIESVVGPDKAPPILDGIGARVRPDWMFKFLKDPSSVKIRPWINVRMPTFQFTDEQANAIIAYFSSLNNVPDHFSSVEHKAADPAMIAAGEKIASKDVFSCFSCHIQNGKTPASSPEQWGPDLALARDRIRYDFIPEWVKDPQKFTPGVKMPAFLPSDDAAVPGILDGNRQRQAEAIRDFVMHLGSGPSKK